MLQSLKKLLLKFKNLRLPNWRKSLAAKASRFWPESRPTQKEPGTARFFFTLSRRAVSPAARRAPARPRAGSPMISRSCSQLPTLELRPQPRHGLAVQLAHARFGHAEHRADLLEVHVLFVIQAHQQLLAFGQLVDGHDER